MYQTNSFIFLRFALFASQRRPFLPASHQLLFVVPKIFLTQENTFGNSGIPFASLYKGFQFFSLPLLSFVKSGISILTRGVE